MADIQYDAEGLAQQIATDDNLELEGGLWGVNEDEKEEIDHELESKESDSLIEHHTYEKQNIVQELGIVYRKLLITTIIIFILCLTSLIAGILDNVYTWRGITFNCLVVFGSLFGLYLGIYFDQTRTINFKIFKLKLLLFYFILCVCFCIIIFAIQLVYFVIIPLHHSSSTRASILVMVMICYFIAVLFWIVFVLFYVDIVARTCLKRGRTEWIVNYIKTEQAIFGAIFRKVLVFRKRFRSLRAFLTKITRIQLINTQSTLSDKYKDIKAGAQNRCRRCCHVMWKWTKIVVRIICILCLCYLLFPMLILCMICALFILPGIFVFGYVGHGVMHSKGVYTVWVIVSVLGGIVTWWFLWSEVICTTFSYDAMFWSWKGQCAVWYECVTQWMCMQIFAQILLALLAGE
eukprot:976627_1